jgi:HD-GYP domain-containing protein (c-di-GMP phosphodiesterase class II)
MNSIKRRISTKDLKVGMVTADEIRHDNHVLIGKCVTISIQLINKLRYEYFINEIEVFEEAQVVDESVQDLSGGTIEAIEKKFNEFSADAEKIFYNMLNLKLSGIEEIRRFAAKIQNELNATSTIVKNIVIYGSGSDTIYRHGINVAALSAILGRWLGLPESQINLLTYSAILHDFGKTKINHAILDKTEPLSQKEFNQIKLHPSIGYEYIKKIPFLDKSVSYGVLMHHEKMDGSGYPLGLSGDKIHPFARIIAIADIFDAVNSDRVYKKSKGPFEALEIVQKESLGRLDYEYCKVFLSHIVNYYMGENVLLNTGKVFKIIQVDPNDLKAPLLLGDNEFVDLKRKRELSVEKLIC